MNLICKIKFGSHLYGTDTPDSDTDYKGIYMPTLRELILGTAKKTINLGTGNSHEKNTKDDVDFEVYSLPYFLELAMQGETAALDMLHATSYCTEQTSDIWKRLVEERHLFYTRNLKSFVGYARKQAAKYGIKGSRLNVAEEFLSVTKDTGVEKNDKLEEIWESLPTSDHSRFIADNPQGMHQYEICGKVLQSSMRVYYARAIIKGFVEKYGHRAKEAAENKGIDWKAISHALRAAYQVKEILTEGNITFPLRSAGYLKSVKRGELDYMSEVAPTLELLMDQVETLSKESDLPDEVDRGYWADWLVYIYTRDIG